MRVRIWNVSHCLDKFYTNSSFYYPTSQNEDTTPFSRITVPDTVTKDKEIMLLYGLTNYYQNHRMYRRSQSFAQLLGDEQADCLDQYCEPYRNGKHSYFQIPPHFAQ